MTSVIDIGSRISSNDSGESSFSDNMSSFMLIPVFNDFFAKAADFL